MKVLLILLLAAASLRASAQDLDSCGLDDLPRLNAHEAAYLNQHFKHAPDSFDFSNKKIAFITGSSGSVLSTKSRYFNDVRQWHSNNSEVAAGLIILSKEEKAESGGYDAIVTYWVKFISRHRKKEIIRQLANPNP